jgi:F-type H+-transporting ATPase subunit gamma
MNLRQIRKKIRAVSNVKKITNAMQLVSAIKMKKAQQKAFEGKPYRQLLSFIIQKVAASLIEKSYSPLLSKTNPLAQKDLVIFITSNKGLCGGFNFNIFRFLVKEVDFKKVDFITVGKKGALFVKKMGGVVIADFSSPYEEDKVSAIFKTALNPFLKGEYANVFLVYNRFLSTVHFEPVKKIIFPIKFEKEEFKVAEDKEVKKEYIIEPSPEKIIDSALRNMIEVEIYGALIESEAAEHSARMMAMKNATDSATDVIYNLTLLRNKVRQEKVTYELLDMVTAKQSVEEN